MKRINKFFFIIFTMLVAFFVFESNRVFAALDDFVVINANSNGEATNIHRVSMTSDQDLDNDGVKDTIIKDKQFTTTRDITLTINAPQSILDAYDDFIVCEVLEIVDGQEKTDVNNCPKYSLSENVHSYQLKSINDGDKVIYIIFNHEGNKQWDTNVDDIIRKEVALDTTGPVITLKGGEYLYIPAGKKYSELGATCEDDSNILSTNGCSVVIEEKSIDMKKTGFQYIRYTAVDFLGNEVNVLRKVMVEMPKKGGGIDLYWYIAGLGLFALAGFLTIKVIKNKEKQKNQSVL